MLPYVRLRVDYAHVRLFCTTVHEHPVVLVQKRMTCVVLMVHIRGEHYKTQETNPQAFAGPWLHFLRKGS